MTGPGGAQLNYQLFLDSTRTTNWDNTRNYDLTGNGNANIIVYGQMPTGKSAVPGTYTDTISSGRASFSITATVQSSCLISTTALNFGTYARTR
jgi:spore coat protein U-like protein